MSQQPSFYITEADYRRLIPTGSWRVNDIPLDIAQQVREFFGISSSFALFVSGAKADPDQIRPEDSVLAGCDWIRHETNPQPNEPELNVYHFLVGSGSAGRYPVYSCGHSGSLAPGWSTLEHLSVYLKNSETMELPVVAAEDDEPVQVARPPEPDDQNAIDDAPHTPEP